ncbi:serine hydrolase [Spirosoma endophyticum]|uniref:N-acyl-D-aspartate/D-glutamate deacylase n=1 Tax=Spirosoma endophyticum TaxID=662367 RepID=A0A1I1FER1_9BACT|nr:serine hydrolase [Spirosoma endophyticum]SFB97969.1 N-acyl-D-aspartate/D-glutamate deacylase [Spirosoma endophyticum]
MKSNLLRYVLLAFVIGQLTAQAQSVTSLLATRLKTLDSTLTVLHDRAMFNGVVLVAEQGNVTYAKALGTANIATNEPLNTSSAFNLASVSKQFMAMMIMQLQERGKLRYDEPVHTYLPDFPYEKITVRHLLNHTSGLPEYFDLAQKYLGPLDTLTNEGMLQLLHQYKPALVFQPGDRWEYCNTGYVLLGSIITKVGGMPIETFFDQHIVRPLKLKNTYIYYHKSRTTPRNRVFGFQRQNGKNVPNDLIRIDGVIGDGNVYASAEDLLVWDQALYTEKLIKASTLREAFTPVKLNSGATYPYGFGWMIEEGGNVIKHTGGWVGFRTLIIRYIDKKQTVIVLTSGTSAAGRVTEEILAGKAPVLAQTKLITNIRLIDGTGLAAKKAAVRLQNDRIWEVGELTAFPNEPVTNGSGMVLAPGFIDSHSHHDWGLKPDALPVISQGVTTIVVGQDGGGTPMDSLQARLKRQPVAVNVASYTGHAMVRQKVMGANGLYRTAKPDEVARMKTMLRTELHNGSLGLSTGLEYESAFFSNRDEVIQLAQVAADSNGRYISHIRSEDMMIDDAIDEIIQIGRITKMPVQISHIKIALRDQWGQSSRILAQLEQARSEGINITADCYPYDYWMSTLRVLFPKRDYTNAASAEFAVNQLFDPMQSVLVRFAANPSYAGKTIDDIAQLRHEKSAQTLMGLVAEASAFSRKNPDADGIEGIMGKSMDEPDVKNFLIWPHTVICSDGAYTGHPRGYGAFTRVLGRYVRDQKLMPLETAIYKMTGLSAEHLGLKNRGIIAPGYYADLVLLNPDTVQDNARIGDSSALSTGIEAVWVAGKLVYKEQKATGEQPGVLIRRE